jgi:hypothetical protein
MFACLSACLSASCPSTCSFFCPALHPHQQDVPGELAIAYPQLYSETRCQTARDFYRAWLLWCVIGLWHGAACFYVPMAALGRRASVSGSGSHVTVAGYGTAVMTAVIITVTLRVRVRLWNEFRGF